MRAVIQRVQHAGVRIVGCDTVAAYEKKGADEAKEADEAKGSEEAKAVERTALSSISKVRCLW